VGVTVAASLIVAMNGQMLGIARLAYSLATNRQIPSLAGRLHEQRGTPYIAITLAAVIAFGLAIPHDLEFLAGIFAFGAMVTFSIAHVSVIVLRYRESGRPSAFRVPVSFKAGRLAADHADETEGGAVVEALYVFEIPMSLPIDARVPDERVKKAKQVLARAKEVGEEYEGVEVATAMVRGRTIGQAIVSEAKRRGVEAIVIAAEEPTRVRGGAILGGRGRSRERFVGETTRYVVEKAPCKVILTAPPAGEEGTREGVLP
jgi:nucleotide-binding universal stress UspA family protein